MLEVGGSMLALFYSEKCPFFIFCLQEVLVIGMFLFEVFETRIVLCGRVEIEQRKSKYC